MNLSVGGMAPKLKMIFVLVAAAVALTVTLVSVSAPAGAYSGGTATSTGSGGDGGKYQRLWRKTSRRNKRWARHTAECESGKNPDAIGGGGKYRGAFQFTRPTWRQAPKTPGGDPIKYGYRTQAVVAVSLKKREGTSAWPNCG
jgi:soluble lytic murein transglycosylase-like protein